MVSVGSPMVALKPVRIACFRYFVGCRGFLIVENYVSNAVVLPAVCSHITSQ